MKQFISVFVISLFFVACQKEETIVEQQLQEQTIVDVAYGSDPLQKMDVYLPANRNTIDTKVFVMIHGGAWFSGDKTELNEYVPVFKQRMSNYAIFNLNYRLAVFPSTNIFPAQENDIKAALEFIKNKAAEYKFNIQKLAVLGASAGGHLALLQAYKNTTPKVNALVDMFGPADMAALYNSSNSITQPAIQALLAGTPATNAALYQSSSPINFVTAQSPPTLILHGTLDQLVPIAQSNALKTKLQTAGATVQMVTYPNEGHSWTGASLNDTYDKVTAFLVTHNQ